MTAGRAYALGVAALLAGDESRAVDMLRAAVGTDPGCVRAQAALAIALRATGEDDGAAEALAHAQAARRLPRRDRHHVTVIALTLAGDLSRASALGHEHLAEFPDDDVVRHVVGRWADLS
jgi:hypothetical protein